jgi:hypothetical protein
MDTQEQESPIQVIGSMLNRVVAEQDEGIELEEPANLLSMNNVLELVS